MAGHKSYLASLLLVVFISLSLPLLTYAAGSAADLMCASCQMNPKQPNFCPHVPCFDTEAGGITSGLCAAPSLCKAISSTGLNGQSSGVDSGLKQLGQMLGQLMGQLMQGSSGSGSSAATTPTTVTTGCTTGYFQTSDITQLSNPCAQYVAPTVNTSLSSLTSSSTSCDSLSQLLGTCSATTPAATAATPALSAAPASGDAPLSVSFSTNSLTGASYTVDPGDGDPAITLSSGSCVPSTSTSCSFTGTYTYRTSGDYTASLLDDTGTSVATTPVTVTVTGNLSSVNSLLSTPASEVASTSSSTAELAPALPNGGFGNIVLSGNGATIFGVNQNASSNSEVAGFYGSNTFSGQPQSLAAQLCQSRPWASNIVSAIIPSGFFDGICTWAGYQVGAPAVASTPAPTVQLQQSVPASQPTATSTPAPAAQTPTGPAQVQIWAVPASVPLDTRTTVFWSAQGVTQCTETSPDGSFSENTLSGGAATVPLTAATTFTISCIDPNGNPVTNYVTVNLSI